MSTINETAANGADSAATIFVNDYFGGCPECGRQDGYLNVGRSHFIICDEHKVGQCIGENLFSSWKDETEGDWDRNRKLLEGYTPVEFLPEGTWSRDLAKRQIEMAEFDRKRREDAVNQHAAQVLRTRVNDEDELPF
jgi:hypothetical protein